MTYIARRECCCRAYKCNRIPNYGLPPQPDARAPSSVKDGDSTAIRPNKPGASHHRQHVDSLASPDSPGHEKGVSEAPQSAISTGPFPFDFTTDPVPIGSGDAGEKRCGERDARKRESGQPDEAGIDDLGRGGAGPQREEQQQHSRTRAGAHSVAEGTASDGRDSGKAEPSAPPGQASQGSTTSGGSDRAATRSEGDCEEGASNGEEPEARFEEGSKDDADGEAGRSGVSITSAGLPLSGRAIACREHALEGMVYLGQRYLYPAGCLQNCQQRMSNKADR